MKMLVACEKCKGEVHVTLFMSEKDIRVEGPMGWSYLRTKVDEDRAREVILYSCPKCLPKMFTPVVIMGTMESEA